MPRKISQPMIEEEPVRMVPEKPKKKRTMTPELLEKLKVARELALKAKKEGKQINQELDKAKKETFSEKIDQVETYRKLKDRVEDEVKQNEIVSINKRLSDMHSKFDGFLEERQRSKLEKAQRKEQKHTKEQTKDIARALPAEMARKMIQDELREEQLKTFRMRHFGI